MMGYNKIKSKKKKKKKKPTKKTKQNKTKLNLLASSRKGFTKGDDMLVVKADLFLALL